MRQPSKSNILIVLIEGDSLEWPGLEVEELLFNGESAECEQAAGMLLSAIEDLFTPPAPGTYFLFGFQASYSKDYFGEMDVDYELEGWRIATGADQEQFYEQASP